MNRIIGIRPRSEYLQLPPLPVAGRSLETIAGIREDCSGRHSLGVKDFREPFRR